MVDKKKMNNLMISQIKYLEKVFKAVLILKSNSIIITAVCVAVITTSYPTATPSTYRRRTIQVETNKDALRGQKRLQWEDFDRVELLTCFLLRHHDLQPSAPRRWVISVSHQLCRVKLILQWKLRINISVFPFRSSSQSHPRFVAFLLLLRLWGQTTTRLIWLQVARCLLLLGFTGSFWGIWEVTEHNYLLHSSSVNVCLVVSADIQFTVVDEWRNQKHSHLRNWNQRKLLKLLNHHQLISSSLQL